MSKGKQERALMSYRPLACTDGVASASFAIIIVAGLSAVVWATPLTNTTHSFTLPAERRQISKLIDNNYKQSNKRVGGFSFVFSFQPPFSFSLSFSLVFLSHVLLVLWIFHSFFGRDPWTWDIVCKRPLWSRRIISNKKKEKNTK